MKRIVLALALLIPSIAYAQTPIVGTPSINSGAARGAVGSYGTDGAPNIGTDTDTACSSVVSTCTMIALMKAIFGAALNSLPSGGNHIGNVNLQDTGDGNPYSATATGSLVTEDTSGYAGVEIGVTSIGTTNTITVTGADDSNTGTFAALNCRNLSDPTQQPSSTITATGHYWCTGARWIQIAVTTYTSGTVTVVPYLRGYTPETGTRWVSIMPPVAGAPGGLTGVTIDATAGTNAGVIIGHSARLYTLNVCNTTATQAVFKLYDRNTNPVVGTSIIKEMFVVPANSCAPAFSSTIGIYFQFGIAIAMTQNPASSDTTAVLADSVVGTLTWF